MHITGKCQFHLPVIALVMSSACSTCYLRHVTFLDGQSEVYVPMLTLLKLLL